MELLSSHYDTISQYYLNKWGKKSFADLDEDKFNSLCLSVYESLNRGMTSVEQASKDHVKACNQIDWLTILRLCEIDILECCNGDKQKLSELISEYNRMNEKELQLKYVNDLRKRVEYV